MEPKAAMPSVAEIMLALEIALRRLAARKRQAVPLAHPLPFPIDPHVAEARRLVGDPIGSAFRIVVLRLGELLFERLGGHAGKMKAAAREVCNRDRSKARIHFAAIGEIWADLGCGWTE